MGLRIIYGKSGTGKSEYCFLEIAKLIKNENKIYIITPEQFSFTEEKKLMKVIKCNSLINAEVLTLSRMAYRVMQELGKNTYTKLTKCGKAMIIYSILNENKKKFKFLNKSDENIELAMAAITEFKKHGITPNQLSEEIDKIENEYLKIKLQDINIIYQNFENKLINKYIEDEDMLTILRDNIEKTDVAQNAIIYIDEFAGFTKQEYAVIEKLLKIAKQVNVTICADDLEENTNPDIDIFYTNKITAKKLIDIAKKDNIEIEEKVMLEENKRLKTEELKHMEKNIYNSKSQKYEKETKNINLFLAKNQYSEIENVAKKIHTLVKKENLRYKDIAIITQNIESYSSLVKSIFNQYNIPVFIDEKRDLNQNIVIKYILSIFEMITSNFSRESVFNYLKIGFSEIDRDDIFKLENYCIKWGIKNNKFKENFIYGINENNKEEIEYLNKLREKIISPIIQLKKEMNDIETTTIAIYNFLKEQNIEQKIIEKTEKLKEKSFIEISNEYISSYKILLDVLDEIMLVFKNEKLTIDKYMQILKIGLKNSELGKIPQTQDQVVFGDISRSRTHKVDVIFVIGLNDGNFPSVNRAEGFLGDKDREILKQDGIEIAKGTIENIYEERFNIYKMLSTAEKQIYLSYSSSESEGKSLRPSIMISKIKKIFPNLIEESDIIEKNYQLTNMNMTYQELLENISNVKENKKIDKIWYTVYEYYKKQNEWYQRLKKDIEGINYTNLPTKINDEVIEKLYGNVMNTSISKLEKFAKCPFSYYLQYGLKIKEKEELKIQSFDTGSFMHEIIDEFFKKVKEEKKELSQFIAETEELEVMVEKIINDKLNNGKSYNFSATPKYNILVKRLKRTVTKALKFIVEGLVYSEFEIEGTEVEFDRKGKFKSITIQLDNGKKVEIVGKIDRLDTAKSEDGKYLRIIDYKSSAKDIDLNEVYAGIQIQLLTYMDAVCKEEDLLPAGVLYFSLLEQVASVDKKIDEEEIEEELRKNFKMKGLILADVKVIKMHDKNLESGYSKLIPARITNSGQIVEKNTNGVTKEEFKILQDYIYKTIKQMAKEIYNGNIEIKPYNKSGITACEYCKYKTICGFNPQMCKNTYNYIEKKTKDDIILMMKNKK